MRKKKRKRKRVLLERTRISWEFSQNVVAKPTKWDKKNEGEILLYEDT